MIVTGAPVQSVRQTVYRVKPHGECAKLGYGYADMMANPGELAAKLEALGDAGGVFQYAVVDFDRGLAAVPDREALIARILDGDPAFRGEAEITTIRVDSGSYGESERFWFDTDTENPFEKPYGDDTVRIIDQNAGGVIAYCHEVEVDEIISALEFAAQNGRF